MKIPIGPTEKVAVMGMNDTGKTVVCRLLARAARPSVAVWDPLGQYPADVAYRPARLEDLPADRAKELRAGEFDRFVRAIYFDPPKRLIVEEAEQVLPQRGGQLPPWFNEFSMPGRNLGLSWVLNMRAPQMVEKVALNLAAHFFIFKLEGTSVDYMRNWVGRHNRATFDKMLSWKTKDHKFFHYHAGDLVECPALPKALVDSLEKESERAAKVNTKRHAPT